MNQLYSPLLQTSSPAAGKVYPVFSTTRLYIYIYIYISADVLSIGDKQYGAKYKKLVFRYFFIFLITDFIALIAVNNLLDIQLLPSIPSC